MNALQSLLSSCKTGWLSRAATYVTSAIPFPGVPAIGSYLAEKRTAAFAKMIHARLSAIEAAARSDDEIEDLFLRTLASAARAESTHKAERLAIAFTTLAASDMDYVEAVDLINHLDILTDFDMQVLSAFFKEARAKAEEIHSVVNFAGRPKAEDHTVSLGYLLACIEKLQSRGLLVSDDLHGSKMRQVFEGGCNHWSGRAMNRGYAISPVGDLLSEVLVKIVP